jgi:RNA polymerase sigma-70 factor, ECF subfamily
MKDVDNDQIRRLAQQASEGNHAAFSDLMRMFMNQIVALTYRMTGERDTALDLAQDTFISAWENLTRFRGDSRFDSWLYRIAVNKSLNYIAHKKVENPAELNEDYFIQSQDSPHDQMEDNELKQQVLSFMQSLPEQQRAVFELRFYRQLQFDEIAAILDRSVPTVKTNFREAIKKLRTHAEKEGWRP